MPVDGTVVGLETFLGDVSGHAECLRNGDHLDCLLRNAGDGFHVIDMDGHDDETNRSEPLSHDDEQLEFSKRIEPRILGRAVGEIVPPNNAERAEDEKSVDTDDDFLQLTHQPGSLRAERFVANLNGLADVAAEFISEDLDVFDTPTTLRHLAEKKNKLPVNALDFKRFLLSNIIVEILLNVVLVGKLLEKDGKNQNR